MAHPTNLFKTDPLLQHNTPTDGTDTPAPNPLSTTSTLQPSTAQPFKSTYASADYGFQNKASDDLYTILGSNSVFSGLSGPPTVNDVQKLLDAGAIPNQEHLRNILYRDHVGKTPQQKDILQLLMKHGARPVEKTFISVFTEKNDSDLLDVLFMPNGKKLGIQLTSDVINTALMFDYPRSTIEKLIRYGVFPSDISDVFAKTPEMKEFIRSVSGTPYGESTPCLDCLADVIVCVWKFLKSLFGC